MFRARFLLWGACASSLFACGHATDEVSVDARSLEPVGVELIDGGTALELLGGVSLDFSSTRLSELALKIEANPAVTRVELTVGTERLVDDSAPFLFAREDGFILTQGLNQLIVAGFDATGMLIHANTLLFFIVVDDGADVSPPEPEPDEEPVRAALSVTSVELRRLDDGRFIKTLQDGDTIDLSAGPYKFDVITDGAVESVSFASNGSRVHIENGAPWEDRIERYPLGRNDMRFVPWSEDAAQGEPGVAFDLTIMVEEGVETPRPDADVVLASDYGRSQYRPGLSGPLVFDAYDATWEIDNCGWSGTTITGDGRNAYPVLLESRLNDAEWYGGTWTGNIPQSTQWGPTYRCEGRYSGNSAALLFRGDGTAIDIRMDGAWDAIRFDTDNGEVRDSWISNSRDDGIEADTGANLWVENVLFDNCFVGVSSTPRTDMTSSRSITLRNVLMSLGNYNYSGRTQPGAFFKYTGNSPSTEVHDSVFAFSRDSSINNGRVGYAWEKMTSCSNNLLLWTSDAPFPVNFPRPPSCFQVIEGAEARRIWEERRAQFIANW